MGIRVNQNVQSLIARRNLETTNGQLTKSLERLSSGLRINRAADDAAGLAISEGLRSQIQSLAQATRNAGDGLSMLQTAEGALQESTNILQRIRVLAVQSANGTNSSGDRANLQLEVDELISELQRIGSESEFNGTALLDGTVSNFQLQVGGEEGQIINFSISDFRATRMGAVAEHTSARAINTGDGIDAAGELTLNGIDIAATSAASDTLSLAANASESAIALAAAINAQEGETGVRASVEEASQDGTAAVTAFTAAATGANQLSINGQAIIGSFVNNDSDGALRDAINGLSNLTGVTATVVSNELVLTAEDGRNINIAVAGTGANSGFADGDVIYGDVKLSADTTFVVGGTEAANLGFTAASYTVDPTTTAVNTVNISTVEGANAAFEKVDNALRQINQGRAQMGAVQNRLESSINGLRIQRENLVAAESRIRDVDFAEETAELTRNQILQQAGTAILAQANVLVPQSALSLLG